MRHLLVTFLAACTVEKIPIDSADSGTDEDCQRSWWVRDADADGFGDNLDAVSACDAPDGYVVTGGDCDDQVATTYPGALETCNGVDDDCDGIGDAADASWYDDDDGDGFGDPATLVVTCQPAEGQVLDGTDCDDADAGAHPGAEEVCGDLDDDDCDGFPDRGAESADWHTDDDGDGFGHMYNHEVACDPDPAWVLDGTDCRPNDAEAFPGAEERCNDDDDNCDRQVDEGFDEDGDGFLSTLCDGGDDCDDTHAEAWPGNPEDACEDGVDGDCDGLDRPCGFWGETLATDMDGYAYSDQASFDAGRLVDVGDATGDGIGDVLVATLYAGGYAGAGYLIPGPVNGTDTLENMGHRIEGSTSLTYGAGRSIGIGDVDVDGIEDVAFGAPYGSYAGMYIELGPIAEDRDLTSPDIWLECQSSIYCGHGGDIGDVSGDGVADAVVGAYYTSGGVGTVYIAQGPLSGDLNLHTDAEVEIEGESAGYYTARHIYAGGDYNGDGLSDLQVAAPYASAGRSYGGVVYVLLAPVTITDFSMSDARLLGPANTAYLGTGAAMGSGDVDGDGYDDVGVGASSNASSSTAGGAYVLFGPVSGDYDVGTDADVTVEGAARGDYAGTSVAMGDINDDGVDELLIGASGDATGAATAGGAFLFLTPTAGSWLTTDADAWFPSVMTNSGAGTAVVLKDTNGDGADDVVVGAPADATGATAGGAVYVMQAGF